MKLGRMIPALLVLAVAMSTAPLAAAQSIWLTDPSNGGLCAFELRPFEPLTLQLVVNLSSQVPGITGAEFAVHGLPPQVLVNVSANQAAAVVIGDPFAGGCNIAFADCQSGPSFVSLFTVTLYCPADPVPDMSLEVVAHVTPTNPQFVCPLVVLCDAPAFTSVCVFGGSTFVGRDIHQQPPKNPSPANGAANVSTSAQLHWVSEIAPLARCTIGTFEQGLYFGKVANPPFVTSDVGDSYNPGHLLANTTYYWKVTADSDGGSATSPVWSFTTNQTVAVGATSWTAVKDLYRKP